MLSFFRKIRKSLVDSSSAKRYLLYAVGEILLVMVGILLALQVNNWNETQKEIKEEKLILTSLHSELLANQTNIMDMTLWFEDIHSAILILLKEAASSNPKLSDRTVDTLLAKISWFQNASTFQMSASDAIISSGRLSIIQDESLRQQITAWNLDVMEVIQTQRQDYDNFNEVWMPYLRKTAYLPQIENSTSSQPGSTIENYGPMVNFGQELRDHTTLLLDDEFQNILLHRLWVMSDILYDYDNIEPRLTQLIESIEGVIMTE